MSARTCKDSLLAELADLLSATLEAEPLSPRGIGSDYSIAFEIQRVEIVIFGVSHGARDHDEWKQMLL